MLFFPEARKSISKIHNFFVAHLKVFEPVVKSDDEFEIGTADSKVSLDFAYGALFVHYRTYSNKFAWELSALYFKGSQAVICVFVVFILFLIVFYFTTHYLKVKYKKFKLKKQLEQVDLVASHGNGNKRLYYSNIDSLLFDIGVMGVLNYYFVRVTLD
eukprot:gene12109-16210_t